MGSSHYSRPRYKVGFREAAAETGVLGYLGGFCVGGHFLIFFMHFTDWPLLPAVLVLIGSVLGGFLIGTFMGIEADDEDHTPWRSSSTASTATSWSSLPPARPQLVDDVPSLPSASSPSSTFADGGGCDGGSGD
ncbi:hypothetical protein EDC02_2849 [Micromonospora sp. Llam0]|uniref:hypothetical protein n=1 Tax=Micromonospora sp. Llam0 TaxID=2485143 RepID=UPI000F4656AB|nr:hypothetical protein [Micromonospora sp. Llam0]ROO60930.1 hypothetical protein EDC02_2849 [Micromonospora sp. Llam0]